jgi:tetratricopeptide (TPR) repeat protein
MYEDYLRARYFLAKRNPEAINKAVAYMRQAVQRDSQFAPAYAGLAIAYDLLGTYELLPPKVTFPKVEEFADKALRLDATLSEAYTARATALSFYELDWTAAERDFERAIALDPNSAFAHHWYAEHLTNIGKPERAASELKHAYELDPLSLPINNALGRTYGVTHRHDQAIRQCRKAIDLDANSSMGHWCLGEVYVGERQYSAAIPELELANALGATPLSICDLGFAYAASGQKMKAINILKALQRGTQSAYFSPYLIAAMLGALGQKDEAFQWLEKAFNERDCHVTDFPLDPKMAPLRSDRRFPPMIQRLKLPE